MTNPDDLVDLLRGAAVYARDPRPDSYAGKNVLGTDMSVHLTRNSLIKDFPCGLIPPVPKRELILQERVVFQQTFSTTSCVSEMGAVTGAGPSPLSTRSAAQIFTDARSRQITLKAMYRLVPPSLKGPAPLCVQLEHPVNRAQEMATDIFGCTSKEFEADELIIRLNKVTMRHTSSNGAMGPLFAVLTTKPIVTPAMSLRIQAICLVALSNAIHICTETTRSTTKTTLLEQLKVCEKTLLESDDHPFTYNDVHALQMRLTIAADTFSHTRDGDADNGYPMTTENAWQLAAQCLYTVINSNPDTVQAPDLLNQGSPTEIRLYLEALVQFSMCSEWDDGIDSPYISGGPLHGDAVTTVLPGVGRDATTVFKPKPVCRCVSSHVASCLFAELEEDCSAAYMLAVSTERADLFDALTNAKATYDTPGAKEDIVHDATENLNMARVAVTEYVRTRKIVAADVTTNTTSGDMIMVAQSRFAHWVVSNWRRLRYTRCDAERQEDVLRVMEYAACMSAPDVRVSMAQRSDRKEQHRKGLWPAWGLGSEDEYTRIRALHGSLCSENLGGWFKGDTDTPTNNCLTLQNISLEDVHELREFILRQQHMAPVTGAAARFRDLHTRMYMPGESPIGPRLDRGVEPMSGARPNQTPMPAEKVVLQIMRFVPDSLMKSGDVSPPSPVEQKEVKDSDKSLPLPLSGDKLTGDPAITVIPPIDRNLSRKVHILYEALITCHSTRSVDGKTVLYMADGALYDYYLEQSHQNVVPSHFLANGKSMMVRLYPASGSFPEKEAKEPTESLEFSAQFSSICDRGTVTAGNQEHAFELLNIRMDGLMRAGRLTGTQYPPHQLLTETPYATRDGRGEDGYYDGLHDGYPDGHYPDGHHPDDRRRDDGYWDDYHDDYDYQDGDHHDGDHHGPHHHGGDHRGGRDHHDRDHHGRDHHDRDHHYGRRQYEDRGRRPHRQRRDDRHDRDNRHNG
jgi:hypothetical protein